MGLGLFSLFAGLCKAIAEGAEKPQSAPPEIKNMELYQKDLMMPHSNTKDGIKRHYEQIEQWRRNGKYS